MLSIYRGRNDYPVKCQLYMPIYEGEGNTKKVLRHEPSEIFCWCKETKPFQTTESVEQMRRKKTTNGTLETITLKRDEINIDWKIMFDDKLFIIESLTQQDDDKQQVLLKGGSIVKTTLNVRC